MSEYFPENDIDIVQRILREGINICEPGEDYKNVIDYLYDSGLINVEKIQFTKCSNKNDEDFIYGDDLECPGLIYIVGEDLYCSECGRPIENVSKKEIFERIRILLNLEGINEYVGKRIDALETVAEIEPTSPFVYSIKLTNGKTFSLVIPPFAEVGYLSSGLFFSEPTLYILPSNIYRESRTVLEDPQYMELADLVTESSEEIIERVNLAATPIDGRQDLKELENKFDEMFERHADRQWQFFEQDFIPGLLNHLAQNPAQVQNYLERLRRLDQTVFGEFHVPIGGAEHTDLRPVNKFSIMNQLIEGNKIGDAKCHRKSSLDYEDISKINLHLDRDQDNDVAVVYVANDNIRPNAWNTILDLKENGRWKIIILQKYLLLELISAVDAVHLLKM